MPNERLAKALGALRRTLGVYDVRTDGRDRLWVLSSPRTLRNTLGPRGTVRRWVYATDRKGSHNAESYSNNADHWSGWEDAINYGLGHLGVKDDWSIYPVPAKKLPRKTWSASTQRWVNAGPSPLFRLCDRPPVPLGSASGPALISFANDIPPLFLSHGVSLEDMREVRKCRGLLWPSFALSWRLPPAYGDTIFFASTAVLPSMLKPSGSPQRDLYLAGTDIWSPTARELELLERAVEWELAGDRKWWQGDREREDGGWGRRDLQNDLLSETLMSDSLVGGMSYFDNWEITEPIKNRNALTRRFRALLLAHADPSDPYAYPERSTEGRTTDTPYPYGELKVTGVVQIHDLPLVIYPKRISTTVTRLLDELGFEGVRLPIHYDGPLHAKANDAERREYASLVTRTLLEWAKDPCHFRGAKIGKALLLDDSWRNTYQPELLWYTRRGWWERGFCGEKDPGEAVAKRLSQPMRNWLANKQGDPSRWGLEMAAAMRSIQEELDIDDELKRHYAQSEVSRFRLSRADARTANSLGWFQVQVAPGDEVVVLDFRAARQNPSGVTAVKQRLLRY